jgi:hypothetical protein
MGKWLRPLVFFDFRAESLLQQILTQAAGSCDPCTVDQIIPNPKVEFVRCLEICMTCKLHHIEFAHTFLKPVTDRRSSKIMELPFFDATPQQDLAEISTEIVDYS